MPRYDLYVRLDGKTKVYKNRPLPPLPTAGMVKAVGRNTVDTLIAQDGVWRDKRVVDKE